MKNTFFKIIVSSVLMLAFLFITTVPSLAELIPHHDTLSMGMEFQDIVELEEALGHDHDSGSWDGSFTQSFGKLHWYRMTANYNDESTNLKKINYYFDDSKHLIGFDYEYGIYGSNFDGEKMYLQFKDQIIKEYGNDYLDNNILSEDLNSFGLEDKFYENIIHNDYLNEYYEILGVCEWHIASDYHTIIDLFCVQTKKGGPLYPYVCYRFVSNEDFEKAEK